MSKVKILFFFEGHISAGRDLGNSELIIFHVSVQDVLGITKLERENEACSFKKWSSCSQALSSAGKFNSSRPNHRGRRRS